jgi:hypothetical protein
MEIWLRFTSMRLWMNNEITTLCNLAGMLLFLAWIGWVRSPHMSRFSLGSIASASPDSRNLWQEVNSVYLHIAPFGDFG